MKIIKTLFLLLLCTAAFAQKKELPEDVVASIKSRIEFGLTPSIVVGIIDKDGIGQGAHVQGWRPPDHPWQSFGPYVFDATHANEYAGK